MAPIPTPGWFVTFLNGDDPEWGGVLISQDHVLTAKHAKYYDGLPARVGAEEGFETAGCVDIGGGGTDLRVIKISPSPKSHTPLPLKTLSDGPLAVYLANQGGLGYLAERRGDCVAAFGCNDVCRKFYPKERPNALCIEVQDSPDVRSGDSGGPVLLNGELVGILIASNSECGCAHLPKKRQIVQTFTESIIGEVKKAKPTIDAVNQILLAFRRLFGGRRRRNAAGA